MVAKNLLAFVFVFLVIVTILFIILTINKSSESQRWRLPAMKSERMVASTSFSKEDPEDAVAQSGASVNTTRVTRKSFVILVYTEFFGIKEWITVNEKCSLTETIKTSCTKDMFDITYDKQRLPESEFVIFHARDMPSLGNMKKIWKDKPSSQFWIYFLQESPHATPDPTPLNGMFDLTQTYRVDSDFWLPYGAYEETPFINISQKDFSFGKNRLVSWMVSNCDSQLRIFFVRELQKYIAVDVFGACSGLFGQHRKCTDNCKDVIKHYKFYLAFENALCKDYITEKYWTHLGEDSVIPIVMGGANYTKLAIPGSFINVLDFKTVKDLADYLHYLDKNSTAFNEYFKWRQKYRVADLSFMCSFCKAVTLETRVKPKGYQDLKDFWVTQGQCAEKDHMVLDMWTHSNSSVYFSLLMTFTLMAFVIIALIVYCTQVLRRGY